MIMTFILIPFFEYEIALSTLYCSDLSPRLTDINSLKYFHELKYFLRVCQRVKYQNIFILLCHVSRTKRRNVQNQKIVRSVTQCALTVHSISQTFIALQYSVVHLLKTKVKLYFRVTNCSGGCLYTTHHILTRYNQHSSSNCCDLQVVRAEHVRAFLIVRSLRNPHLRSVSNVQVH